MEKANPRPSLPLNQRETRRAAWRFPAGFALLAAAGLLTLAGCDRSAPEAGGANAAGEPAEAAITTDKGKASYSIGYQFADNVKRQLDDSIDTEAFVRGVQDRLEGAEMRVSEEEAEQALSGLMAARQAAADAAAVETLEAGVNYLEENAKREGVTALPSGLQYEVLEPGDGPKPGATDNVTTHYEGRLIDGTVFDSSYERGEPASFPLNRVIPGWTEGLQLMSVGAKWRLYVPASLAYGDRAAGQIPANSTLIFDVELLGVEQQGDQEAAPDTSTE